MKKILLIALFLFGINNVHAQFDNSITFSGGIVYENSYAGFINYNYNSNNSNYEVGVLHAVFNMEPAENIKSTFNQTTLQLGYLHNVLRSRSNSIFINIGLGAFAGVEDVPESDLYITKTKGDIIAGAYVVGQLDFYVSDNFAFIARAQENYNFKSTTGKMNPFFAAGLKFNF